MSFLYACQIFGAASPKALTPEEILVWRSQIESCVGLYSRYRTNTSAKNKFPENAPETKRKVEVEE